MRLIRVLPTLYSRPCVATIGNFDGVHQGHQAIIRQLREIADQFGLSAVVIIFEPQPQEYFAPLQAPARLTRLREKFEQIQQYGIDQLVCLRFNDALASLSAEEFIEQLLVDIHIRHLVVGDDFRFGNRRLGDFALLQKLKDKLGFALTHTATLKVNTKRVSSTLLRQALAKGELDLAAQLLGRNYTISGKVIHGDKRGRQLGFATANMALHRLCSPLAGIFATKVYGLDDRIYEAVSSIGQRPMFDNCEALLETHLLDFDANIYGHYLRVEILKRLRAEEKFTDIEALKKQMQQDVQNARKYFADK